MNASWSQLLLILQKFLPEGDIRLWVEPLQAEFIPLDDPRVLAYTQNLAASGQAPSQAPASAPAAPLFLLLTAPHSFAAKRAERCISQILLAAAELMGYAPKYAIQSATPSASPAPAGPKPITKQELVHMLPSAPAVLATSSQLTLPVALPQVTLTRPVWRHSFENFVVGPCNELAHAAARNILMEKYPVDMLFLCSASGLGKTHLSHAVGTALSQEAAKNHKRIEYLSAEEFTSLFVHASKYGEMARFKERFRILDMLILEDVHLLRGKGKTQEELLATMNALQSRGGRVLLTSSFAPRELSGLDSQLVSRFSSGLIAPMEKPNKDTRCHILMEKARQQHIALPPQVAELFASRVESDIRMLESCLHTVMLRSQVSGSPISEEMALDVLHTLACNDTSLSLDALLDNLCKSFALTPGQLASKSRRQDLVDARNTAFYLMRKHSSLTLEEIGAKFGRKHSTVIKGISAIEREISRQSSQGHRFEHAISLIEKNSRRV